MKDVDQLNLRDSPEGVIVPVKVVPGASRDRIIGVLGDCLKIAVASPPQRGKANAAVAALLAGALGMDRRAVQLVRGATGPRKEFRVTSLTAVQVAQRLQSS
jgi:uncharacterized protein (TIGR00251 family)